MRVRAGVALALVGVVLTAPSLVAIRVPVAVYEAENDRWLVTRFHSGWIAEDVPGTWRPSAWPTPGTLRSWTRPA